MNVPQRTTATDDPETTLLIAKLMLEDIEEVSQSRKGKARWDAAPTAEDMAFRFQAECYRSTLQFLEDRALANSIDFALGTDRPLLDYHQQVEQAAVDDHEAALRVSRGMSLPAKTESQRAVESISLPPEPEFVHSSTFSTHSQPKASTSGIFTQREDGPSTSSSASYSLLSAVTSLSQSNGQSSASLIVSVECVACGDPIKEGLLPRFRAPCQHYYCKSCLSDLIASSTRDESLYPPRCCNQPFSYVSFTRYISAQIRAIFDKKRVELDVPMTDRIYCPTPTCSAFLGSSKAAPLRNVFCLKCSVYVCVSCKQKAHPGENCGESASVLQLKELARAQTWQTCPACHAIVELSHGCYHMTCLCKSQFCYVCAAPWKNCRCPQWDEARLYDTAVRRVEQAQGRALVAPNIFQERVRQMAINLQQNHNCVSHMWIRRDGRATCEECRYVLREFILVCRQCSMNACVRCARNRLP